MKINIVFPNTALWVGKIPKNDKKCNTLIRKQKQNEWENAKIKPQKGCHKAEAAKGDATKKGRQKPKDAKKVTWF